ncbi:MAG TPA: Smr/MutS family protein [Thermoanaerobaculia bacterium]|nr:Smr/MutS family protein [Thermoanaerobaculia bacterium]
MDGEGFWEDSLDLHGLKSEAALHELDLWLNRVFFQDIRQVRVVCGWGQGILLNIIDNALTEHPLVERHRAEGPAFIVEIVPRSDDGY